MPPKTRNIAKAISQRQISPGLTNILPREVTNLENKREQTAILRFFIDKGERMPLSNRKKHHVEVYKHRFPRRSDQSFSDYAYNVYEYVLREDEDDRMINQLMSNLDIIR